MGSPDVKADALRAFEVLKAGGIAICPATVGYAILTTNTQALERMFTTKKRGTHKRHGMGGNYDIHKDLHIMSPLYADIVHTLTQTFDLPMGCVAKFKKDHPLIQGIDEETLLASTNGESMSMLINAGTFMDELTKLTFAANLPVLGSSANISGTGTKYRVEDINKEILDIADIVIDYGLVKWWIHGRSSTMLDFSKENIEVVRIGACYDVMKDLLWRYWEIELPNDPGMAQSASGHMMTLPPLETLQKLVKST